LTEEYCNSLKAKEDIYYKCVFDSVSEVCKTEEKKCNEVKILNTRRLSTDKLDDEDCYDLETSNDSKICVAKSDGYGCEEINGSNEINLSFSLFFLFLFL
jgi:predicted RNA-binding protein with PIN domain